MGALIVFAWAAGAVTIATIFRFFYRVTRKVDDAFEFLAELKTNGGTSIKDTVNRIDDEVTRIGDKVDSIDKTQSGRASCRERV